LHRKVLKVVLAKGYGVRKLGEPAKVDEHTLFGIGSNTKAFTTAALAMLVDEGRIDWDDRVQHCLSRPETMAAQLLCSGIVRQFHRLILAGLALQAIDRRENPSVMAAEAD